MRLLISPISLRNVPAQAVQVGPRFLHNIQKISTSQPLTGKVAHKPHFHEKRARTSRAGGVAAAFVVAFAAERRSEDRQARIRVENG